MSRLLFLAVIAAVVYWLLKSYRNQLPKDEGSSGQAEDMVRCVHCGVHLPKNESILAGNNTIAARRIAERITISRSSAR